MLELKAMSKFGVTLTFDLEISPPVILTCVGPVVCQASGGGFKVRVEWPDSVLRFTTATGRQRRQGRPQRRRSI